KLDNGLTYYVYKNSLPKERAMFYLVVNAGAINENEDQNGLAHFCEHMAFNGTKAFPDKGILNYLQSIGVSFGKGLNAGTSSAMTVYTLNDIPTVREGYIDSSLLVLREWASNVTYSDNEINKERGVIHEEWRTGGGASLRMSKITNPVLYAGSKYANHNVIGEVSVIDNAAPDFLRSYYKKWYRPDLQAIVVVGDIDREAVRNKIAKLFSDIPKNKKEAEDVKTLVRDNKDVLVTIATDKEAQNVSIQLYIKHPGVEVKDLNYYKQRLVNNLYNSMLSDRFSELVQKENPPMLSAYSGYSSLTKYQDCYIMYVNALTADPVRSFKAALTENERVKRFGFTAGELERAKKRLLSSYENSFNEKDKRLSGSIVYEYISNFTSGYPAPGITYTYDLAKSFLPTVTLEQVNSLPKEWITDNNQVIVVTGPVKDGVKIPSESELLTARDEVMKSSIEPYVDKVLPTSLIKDELKGSPVIKKEYIKEFDGIKLTLANGARVWLKPTNNKADEILLTAFSNGGSSLIPDADLPSAYLASTIKNSCGIGEFSSQDLNKFLSGKNVRASTGLIDLEELINGSSSVKDFETMLQLTYMKFMPARHDDEVLKSLIQRSKASIENRKANPNSVYSDTLSMLLSNYSPRTLLQNIEFFDRMNIEKAYSIANDRYKDAGDFNFLFVGNIDTIKMIPLIEKYIGSIPDDSREEFWVDHKIWPKKEHFVKRIYVDMKDPKAMNYVYFCGEMHYTPEDAEYINALRYILNMRYVESIREKESGTYGVGVSASLTSRPVNTFKVSMNFTCAPERADYLRGLVIEELNNIKTKGVTEEEVNMTRENFLKEDAERMKTNSFIIDRIENFINNGVYTPLPENSTDIYKNLDGKKIQEMANKVFKDNYFEFVMMPKTSQ
ncbi:MAG: insulinase family protein, partial [Bacteroidia bacterium]|nr:insulinase family protein [Bacteroidia bacterium]